MNLDAPVSPPIPDPPAALVRLELEQILAAPAFAGALSAQRMLRYLIDQSLAGAAARLKESALAIEVFRRPAERYDPTRDTIVRVEARRLRQRLARHYAGAGQHSALRIELPVGQYRPVVHCLRTGPRRLDEETSQALIERADLLMQQGEEAAIRRALQRYAEALGLHPRQVAAHVGVARAWLQLAELGLEAGALASMQAASALRQALAIDPGHGEALALEAQRRHRHWLDAPGAERLHQRALAAAPRSAAIYRAHAASLMCLARNDEADQALQRARQFAPQDVDAYALAVRLARSRRDWGQAEKALGVLQDLAPHAITTLALQGALQLDRGDATAALVSYRAMSERYPALDLPRLGLARAQALAGDVVAARAGVAALDRCTQPYQRALAQLGLGERAAAVASLQEAIATHDGAVAALPVDPALEALHDHPAWPALSAACRGRPLAATARRLAARGAPLAA